MRILVFGAGAIGSLYAAKLSAAGQAVSLFARGDRLQTLQEDGVRLVENDSGAVTHAAPAVVGEIDAGEEFDFVLVCVRADQVKAALPLAGSANSPTIVPMVNHATGFEPWAEIVGRDRLLIGFPAAGASVEPDGVHYGIPSRLLQKTTLGELDGGRSQRLEALSKALRGGGFNVEACDRIDAWQRYHAAYIGAFLLGIKNLEGDVDRFLRTPAAQRDVFMAIKESFALLDVVGFPVTPSNLLALKVLPTRVLIGGMALMSRMDALRQMFATSGSRLAQQEAPTLGEQIVSLADGANLPVPHYRRLLVEQPN